MEPEWQAIVSGNAELELSTAGAGQSAALQMDFDFKGGGGFVVARRALSRPMPEDFAVTFRLRGRGAPNNLELKLVDATGQNVWRHVHKDLKPPARWKRMRVDSQDIEFAWGPSSGGRIQALGSLEFAIVAGAGGKGTWWIADVEIEDCTPPQAPEVTASRPDDPHPWIAIDSMEPRAIGGLIIDWVEGCTAERLSRAGLEQRAALENLVHRRDGGRQTQLRVPARRQDEAAASGSR